jgi:hypothetical protein
MVTGEGVKERTDKEAKVLITSSNRILTILILAVPKKM